MQKDEFTVISNGQIFTKETFEKVDGLKPFSYIDNQCVVSQIDLYDYFPYNIERYFTFQSKNSILDIDVTHISEFHYEFHTEYYGRFKDIIQKYENAQINSNDPISDIFHDRRLEKLNSTIFSFRDMTNFLCYFLKEWGNYKSVSDWNPIFEKEDFHGIMHELFRYYSGEYGNVCRLFAFYREYIFEDAPKGTFFDSTLNKNDFLQYCTQYVYTRLKMGTLFACVKDKNGNDKYIEVMTADFDDLIYVLEFVLLLCIVYGKELMKGLNMVFSHCERCKKPLVYTKKTRPRKYCDECQSMGYLKLSREKKKKETGV